MNNDCKLDPTERELRKRLMVSVRWPLLPAAYGASTINCLISKELRIVH